MVERQWGQLHSSEVVGMERTWTGRGWEAALVGERIASTRDFVGSGREGMGVGGTLALTVYVGVVLALWAGIIQGREDWGIGLFGEGFCNEVLDFLGGML